MWKSKGGTHSRTGINPQSPREMCSFEHLLPKYIFHSHLLMIIDINLSCNYRVTSYGYNLIETITHDSTGVLW